MGKNKWYLSIVLFYISHLISAVEHLFITLRAIYIFFSVNYMFVSFVHFSIRLLFIPIDAFLGRFVFGDMGGNFSFTLYVCMYVCITLFIILCAMQRF